MSDKTELSQEYLKSAYNTIKQYCQLFEEQAKPGMSGWSAESNKGNAVARYLMGDGGYTGRIVSQLYGVTIDFAYTYKEGDTYKLSQGSDESLFNCLQECSSWLEPKNDITIVRKKSLK